MKKFLSLIFAIVLPLSLAGCFNFNTPTNPPTVPPPPIITPATPLQAPTNLAYDKDTYVLSWSSVTNASGYKISYNGREFTAVGDDCQEVIPLTAQENVFKVKALGDDIYYTDSNWSSACSYTVPAVEQSVYDKINLALGSAATAENYELVEVIGISYANVEGNRSGDNVVFETLCNGNGTLKNIQIGLGIANLESIEYLFSNIELTECGNMFEKSIVNYNSAQFLLDSESYDGEMQSLYDQGYTITVIKSCVREGSKVGQGFRFELVGTYKAVKNDEVLYFTSINRIDINNMSSDMLYNYEYFVMESDFRTVTETSFVLHESGATLEYMDDWAKANDENYA